MIIGKPLDEVKKITNKDIADQLEGLPPEKMHCSVMGYEALEDALRGYLDLDEVITADEREKLICSCFEVGEKQILDAIKHNGLKTLEEVINFTKAGGACGKCKGQIEDILNEGREDRCNLTMAQKVLKINSVIDTQISPELRKDGGDINLIDVDGDRVLVKLRGNCAGCKNSTLTLKTFVETTLRDAVCKDIIVIEVA
jgi:NifU-like protein